MGDALSIAEALAAGDKILHCNQVWTVYEDPEITSSGYVHTKVERPGPNSAKLVISFREGDYVEVVA